MMLDAIDQFLGPKHLDFKRWIARRSSRRSSSKACGYLGLFGLIIPQGTAAWGLSNRRVRARAEPDQLARQLRVSPPSVRTAPSA